MNKELQEFARDNIKKGLKMLPESTHTIFKRMYSPNDLNVDVYELVDSMPEDKLDWAMQQVQRTRDNI